jgi:hypothetical protein
MKQQRRSARRPYLTVVQASIPQRRPTLRRGIAFALLSLFCIVLSVAYVTQTTLRSRAAESQAAAERGGSASVLATPPTGPRLMFRDTALGDSYGKLALAPLAAPDGPHFVSSLDCERVYYASGRGICLTADRGILTTYHAVLFDADLQPSRTLDLSGIPSRARISPDGRFAGMTVFVSGHGYDGGGFSTRTTIVDATTGELLLDLEDLTVRRDGAVVKSADFNFWGVTFAQGSNRFYATLGTAGRTYLIEGDLAGREARVIYEGLECPSLSPDDTRVAFKKQIGTDGRSRWQLRILDLATLTETPLTAETRNVDDQAEWLDDQHVLYGLPDDVGTATASTSVWMLNADGSGVPRRLAAQAMSPAVIR